MLTVRGKNIEFIMRLAGILGLDSLASPSATRHDRMLALKKAFGPRHVRAIHEAIPELWPDLADLYRCLDQEAEGTSGLYVGTYVAGHLQSILNRHGLYNDSIILIDPLLDPRTVAPQFNPVEQPDIHLETTFHFVLLWFELAPWIDKGIVSVIRSPGDFNHGLWLRCNQAAQKLLSGHASLQAQLREEAEAGVVDEYLQEDRVLRLTHDQVCEEMRKNGFSESDIESFLTWQEKMRAMSPRYLDKPGAQRQLIQFSSGVNYEMAKHIATRTGSHLITDLRYRLEEMRADRAEAGLQLGVWETFADAFQKCQLKSLQGIQLEDVLKLRKDNYLASMRAFLRKAWTASKRQEGFSQENVEDLTAELHGRICEADREWKKIDQNLAKWFFGGAAVGGMFGVVAANAAWLPYVAAAASGIVNLTASRSQRRDFLNQYPAGFFLEPIRQRI